MVRTQILLTAEQAAGLRELAAREGRSMADVVRDAVEVVLQRAGGPRRDDLKRQSLRALGTYRSGQKSLGADHDAHLAEAFAR